MTDRTDRSDRPDGTDRSRPVPRSLLGYEAAARAGQRTGPTRSPDPFGWCVIATTALLTLALGAVVPAIMAAIGLARYGRAWRRGRSGTQCVLGDVRLVMAYLAAILVVSIIVLVA